MKIVGPDFPLGSENNVCSEIAVCRQEEREKRKSSSNSHGKTDEGNQGEGQNVCAKQLVGLCIVGC